MMGLFKTLRPSGTQGSLPQRWPLMARPLSFLLTDLVAPAPVGFCNSGVGEGSVWFHRTAWGSSAGCAQNAV